MAVTLMAAGSLIALTACSSPSPSSTAAPGAGGNTAAPVEVPGSSAEANAYMNELYQKAQDDGQDQIVLYGPAPSTNAKLNAVFMARFPKIKIVPQDQPDAQTLTKLETEAASGNRIADIMYGGDTSIAASNPKLCTTADVRTGPKGFEIPTAFDGRLTYFGLRYFGFVYNTDMVEAKDAPKNWNDLLDPKWKGKITVGDMTVPGGIRYILTALMVPETENTWGRKYVEKLAAQDLQIAQSEPTVPTDVASGRFPIGIAVYQGFYQTQKDKGAPIAFEFPLDDGGNFMIRSAMCLIKDAPHSDASQLYINWMYSPEGQKALAEKDLSYGFTPDAPGPANLPAIDEFKYLPFASTDAAFNQPYFDFIDETFKK